MLSPLFCFHSMLFREFMLVDVCLMLIRGHGPMSVVSETSVVSDSTGQHIAPLPI